MTTLPSIPVRTRGTADHPVGSPPASARVVWRVLRRDAADGTALRGGGVRTTRVEAILDENAIVIRQLEGEREVSALVLQACGRIVETAAGTLLEWTMHDGEGSEPVFRMLVASGCPPLVRCRLLDRIGVGGGRHEIVELRGLDSVSTPGS